MFHFIAWYEYFSNIPIKIQGHLKDIANRALFFLLLLLLYISFCINERDWLFIDLLPSETKQTMTIWQNPVLQGWLERFELGLISNQRVISYVDIVHATITSEGISYQPSHCYNVCIHNWVRLMISLLLW